MPSCIGHTQSPSTSESYPLRPILVHQNKPHLFHTTCSLSYLRVSALWQLSGAFLNSFRVHQTFCCLNSALCLNKASKNKVVMFFSKNSLKAWSKAHLHGARVTGWCNTINGSVAACIVWTRRCQCLGLAPRQRTSKHSS